MKTFTTSTIKILAITGAFLLLVLVLPVADFSGMSLMAQPGIPDAPNQAPIGGGIALLAAAGGVYAWKKLQQRRPD